VRRHEFISIFGVAIATWLLSAALITPGAAQDFMVAPGVPADAFPKPERPVADIISPIWHDEKERDAANEPRQLVRLLGIKSGMTVAWCDWRRSSGPAGASSRKTLRQNICGA
jgi:hypothetical protein